METKVAVAVPVDSVTSVAGSTSTNIVADWSKTHGNQFDSHSNRAGIKKKPKRSIEAAEKMRMISNSDKEENNFSNTSSLSSSSKSETKDQTKQTPVLARTTRIEEAGVTKKRSSDEFLEDDDVPSSDNGGSGDDCDDEDGDVSDNQYDGDRHITINGYGSEKDRTYKRNSSNKKSKKSHDDSALRDMANVAARLAQNPSSLSEEAKEAAKREYNRLNAARARVRQKDRLQTLEKDYAKLSELTTRLQRENDILKSQLDVLLQTTNKHQAQAVVSSSASSVQLPSLVPPSTLSHLSAAVAGATGALTPSVRSSSTSSSRFNKMTEMKSTSPALQNTELPSVAAVDPSGSSSLPLNMVATTTPKAISATANGSVAIGSLNSNVVPLPTASAATPSTTTVATAASADTSNSTFINSILSTATNLLIQHQQQQQQQQQQKLQSDLQQQQLQQQLLQTPLSSLQNAAVLEQFLRLSNMQPAQLQQLAPLTSPYMQSFATPASTSASAPAAKSVGTLASSLTHQQSQMINSDTRQLMSSLPATMTPNNLNLMGWMLQQQQKQQQMGVLNSNGASSTSATNPYEQSQSSSSSSNQVSGFPFFTTG